MVVKALSVILAVETGAKINFRDKQQSSKCCLSVAVKMEEKKLQRRGEA
jgi:hypothetical protein